MSDIVLLPLLTRTGDAHDSLVVVSPPAHAAQDGRRSSPARRHSTVTPDPLSRMPQRLPGPGEQYRFHFDMGACIGCKCCVVACNEQNGNPAAINWRRVGDIEGGFYPQVARSHLSMSCNHCLEPTCLEGCPVDAYTKDPMTGIVQHSADTCIGCQYCTWNCSYGAPQFNPDRGVVGKCDMCHGRLSQGEAPACVAACPQGAIHIEIVNVSQWRDALEAPAPPSGLPVSDGSLSTTRITMPAAMPPNAGPVDITHVRLEHSHWPLVVMTVLTQLAAGALAVVWLAQLAGLSANLGITAVSALSVGGLALGASTLHLGRPIHAYRALRMWRRSWLSREVLLFSAFAAVAALYAALLWWGLPGSAAAGGFTVALGIAGVLASACIYRVPARPAWNTGHTIAHFLLTGATLGPLFAAAVGAGHPALLGVGAAIMAGAHLAAHAFHFFSCNASDSPSLNGTARLLSSVLSRLLILRGGLLIAGAIVLPLVVAARTSDAGGWPVWSTAATAAALVIALGAEVLGRFLFFVSVVPQHQATPYLGMGSEAA